VIPKSTDYSFNTRLRKDDVDFWRSEVEPLIRAEYRGNRTAFLMAAVRAAVAKNKRRK